MLETFFNPRLINVNLESTDKDEVLEEMLEIFIRNDGSLKREEILASLIAREEKMSTGILPGIAIPHANISAEKTGIGAIGISKSGVDFNSLDGGKTHVFFMLLFGNDSTSVHLKVMQQLAFILKDSTFCGKLTSMTSSEEVFKALCLAEEALV